jgi:hypothetical protein
MLHKRSFIKQHRSYKYSKQNVRPFEIHFDKENKCFYVRDQECNYFRALVCVTASNDVS